MSLTEWTGDTREELRSLLAARLKVKPEGVRIMYVAEGGVRIVVGLPAPAAEELLLMYGKRDPQLDGLIERFQIVSIEPLNPPDTFVDGSGGGGAPPDDSGGKDMRQTTGYIR